jgi:hypothetical protein
MKKLISITAIGLAMASLLPLGLSAQSNRSLKEFYGRPAYWRPYDQTGINVFETSKQDTIPFEGLRLRIGAGFTQQWQSLKHENPDAVNNTGANRLYPLQDGFMTAQANLNTDVQLADGIRLNLTSYLSARHHNETWVKGGYIQFDKLPFKGKFWTNLMSVTTIKVGHMEINYGDQHFRRSDGGQTIYNAFMDNYIVDAFTTEIGGEVLLQKNGFFGQLGVTNGMIKGHIDSTYITTKPDGTVIDDNIKRNPSIYLKGGVDKVLGNGLRTRFTASYYVNTSSAGSGNTLYWGDRTGSNYQNVMEKAPAGAALPASTAVPWSGRVNPGFSKKVSAVMLNGFVKMHGLEFFGTYENATGRTKTETADRKMNQYAGEIIYRIGQKENVFIGGRYNLVDVELAGIVDPTTKAQKSVSIDRTSFAAGWFVTSNVLLKGEYLIQNYKDFPTSDYRAGGNFKGIVIEAVVGF